MLVAALAPLSVAFASIRGTEFIIEHSRSVIFWRYLLLGQDTCCPPSLHPIIHQTALNGRAVNIPVVFHTPKVQ